MINKLILSSLFFLLSCTIAPNLEKPSIKDIPSNFDSSILNKDSVIVSKWWHEFNDNILNELIDSVITNNLDLKIASERVKQFEAIFDIQGSGQYPSLVLKGGYNKRDGKMQLGIAGIGDGSGFIDQKTEQYSLKTGLLLNLDIWGKYRAMSKSANASFRASKYDLQSAYNSLIAQAVSLYFELETLKLQQGVLEKSVKNFKKGMELQKKRYERGTRSRLNLELSKQQYANSKIQLSQTKEAINSVKYSLSFINGKYPSVLIQTSEQNALISELNQIPVGVPAALLTRRSDIKSAEEKLESARFQIGVARSDQFPDISLSADLGFIGKDISDVFKFDFGLLDKTYNVGINQVVFAGGAKSATIAQKWSEYRIAGLNYQKTVLNAFKEVESNLKSTHAKKEQLLYNSEQFKASSNTLKIMKKRYKKGISAYYELLNSERSFYSSEIAYFLSKKNYIQSRINLYLSLGGNF